MDMKFRRLIELGAGEFEHITAELVEHLEGTRCTLKSWGASTALQDAGLYQAAYICDLDGLKLTNIAKRDEIATIIGVETENIIYHYCVCQSDSFYAQLKELEEPLFCDPLSGKCYPIDKSLAANLCELYAANEIDLALVKSKISQKDIKVIKELHHISPFLSAGARRQVQQIFVR